MADAPEKKIRPSLKALKNDLDSMLDDATPHKSEEEDFSLLEDDDDEDVIERLLMGPAYHVKSKETFEDDIDRLLNATQDISANLSPEALKTKSSEKNIDDLLDHLAGSDRVESSVSLIDEEITIQQAVIDHEHDQVGDELDQVMHDKLDKLQQQKVDVDAVFSNESFRAESQNLNPDQDKVNTLPPKSDSNHAKESLDSLLDNVSAEREKKEQPAKSFVDDPEVSLEDFFEAVDLKVSPINTQFENDETLLGELPANAEAANAHINELSAKDILLSQLDELLDNDFNQDLTQDLVADTENIIASESIEMSKLQAPAQENVSQELAFLANDFEAIGLDDDSDIALEFQNEADDLDLQLIGNPVATPHALSDDLSNVSDKSAAQDEFKPTTRLTAPIVPSETKNSLALDADIELEEPIENTILSTDNAAELTDELAETLDLLEEGDTDLLLSTLENHAEGDDDFNLDLLEDLIPSVSESDELGDLERDEPNSDSLLSTLENHAEGDDDFNLDLLEDLIPSVSESDELGDLERDEPNSDSLLSTLENHAEGDDDFNLDLLEDLIPSVSESDELVSKESNKLNSKAEILTGHGESQGDKSLVNSIDDADEILALEPESDDFSLEVLEDLIPSFSENDELGDLERDMPNSERERLTESSDVKINKAIASTLDVATTVNDLTETQGNTVADDKMKSPAEEDALDSDFLMADFDISSDDDVKLPDSDVAEVEAELEIDEFGEDVVLDVDAPSDLENTLAAIDDDYDEFSADSLDVDVIEELQNASSGVIDNKSIKMGGQDSDVLSQITLLWSAHEALKAQLSTANAQASSQEYFADELEVLAKEQKVIRRSIDSNAKKVPVLAYVALGVSILGLLIGGGLVAMNFSDAGQIKALTEQNLGLQKELTALKNNTSGASSNEINEALASLTVKVDSLQKMSAQHDSESQLEALQTTVNALKADLSKSAETRSNQHDREKTDEVKSSVIKAEVVKREAGKPLDVLAQSHEPEISKHEPSKLVVAKPTINKEIPHDVMPKTEKAPRLVAEVVKKTKLKPQTEQAQEPLGPKTAQESGRWVANLVSFRQDWYAQGKAAEFAKQGVAVQVVPVQLKGETWYRLRTSGFANRTDALNYANRAKRQLNLSSVWVTDE